MAAVSFGSFVEARSLRQMDAAEGPLEQQILLEWAVFTSTASLGTRSVR